MKIVVIDYAATAGGGALTILKSFYNFARTQAQHDFIFILDSTVILERCPNIEFYAINNNKKSRCKRLFFDYHGASTIIKKFKPNAVISFQNTIVRGLGNIPQFLYVHQPIPFQKIKKYSCFKREEFNFFLIQYAMGFFIKRSIRRSEHVFVQTNWLKEAIFNDLKYTNITVIPPLLVDIDWEQYRSDEYNFQKFFYPAGNEPYKNHKCIYEAVKYIDTPKEYEVITTSGYTKNNIKNMGIMPYEEVLRMMAKSVLIFPSYIETYGLPLFEARSLGAVVLASDTAFSHEILSGYENAFFFDPFEPEQLAILMQKCIDGKIFRKKTNVISNQRRSDWQSMLEIIEKRNIENDN